MSFEEKTIETHRIYDGRIICLRKDKVMLQNGSFSSREVIEHNGGVCVAAITENNEVLMVRQFRYPYFEELIELPAGKLDKGEDPLECGKRELKEETGVTAESFTDLGIVYPSPGYSSEKLYLYLAKGLSFGEQQLDSDEFLEAMKVPFSQALEMAADGTIKDAKTIAALFRASVKLGITE